MVQLSVKTQKLQELFGEWQVEPYAPPSLIDGKIPRNNFGNVDLFTPAMLPVGCLHEIRPNAAKVAKSIGIDYAEACIGFSFHGGRAAPDISGIVIRSVDLDSFNSVLQLIAYILCLFRNTNVD